MEYLKKCLLRFFCGGCISAAVLCQPFLVIPIFVVSIVALIQPKMRKCIISIYIGILFTASVYLILFFSADDMEGYINGLNYILSDPDHGTSAIIIMRRIIGGHIKNNSIIVLLGLCIMTIWAIYLCKKKQELPHSFHLFQYILCLASIIKPIICISVIPCYSVFGAITIATFPSMVYMILKKQWNDDVVLYCFGLAVAFSFGLGSNTWYDAMQSGYCISSMAALLCIYENTYKYLLKTEKIQKNKRIYSVTLHAFCTALLITVFVQRLLGFYFDAPLTKMTKRITDGPARGIYTTEENYRQYNNMLNVLKSEDIFQDKSAKIIHSYSNFPHQ